MRFIVGLFSFFVCAQVFAADVGPTNIEYVYQLDSEPAVFEFSTGTLNGCGSYHYRVNSPNEAVANRKFSLVLVAFSSGKRVMFSVNEVCEGDRAVVGWVRLVN